MILPIHVYGSPALRQRAEPVEALTPEVQQLIDDMVDTMHAAHGLGLAAPQVGRPERLFVIDLSSLAEELLEETGAVPEYARRPIALINPELEDVPGAERVQFEEGCLSIPDIRDTVERPDAVRIRYRDRDFQVREIEAAGVFARVLQHEYDHLEGILFIDRLGPLRRRMIRRRLRALARGEVEADYDVKRDV